jgi:hypothetical protein
MEFRVNGKKVPDLSEAFGREFEDFLKDGISNHLNRELAEIRCDAHPDYISKASMRDFQSGEVDVCCEAFAEKLRQAQK